MLLQCSPEGGKDLSDTGDFLFVLHAKVLVLCVVMSMTTRRMLHTRGLCLMESLPARAI